MTAVTIRPTFKKDSRPNNGLEVIADDMQEDKTRLFRVVGTVKYAGASVSEEGEITPAAKFITLEVIIDPHSTLTVDALIDERRKERGLGNAQDIPIPGQMTGQIEFDFEGPDDGEPTAIGDVRLTGAGPREVPEASGEELTAELDERREAKAAVPAAEFSGGVA